MSQNTFTPPIPGHWMTLRLDNVSEITSGVTKGRKLVGRTTTSVPYLRVANVQAGYLDLQEIKEIEVPVEEVDKYRLQPGDVVMTEGGDPDKLGRGAVWQGEVDLCLHQNHIFRVRPHLERLDSQYLKAYLGSKTAQKYFLRCAKQTTGIASINMTQLRAFPVPLPPLEEQRRIAAILDRADAVRRKRQEAIRLTEELLRSTFLEMFGSHSTKNVTTISELLEQGILLLHKDGNHGSNYPKASEFSDTGVPFLAANCFTDSGNLVTGNVKFLSEEKANQLNIGWLKPGDVLLAHNATVGRVDLYDGYFDKALVGTSLTIYRPNPNKLLPEFLWGALRAEPFQQQLQQNMGQTTRNQVPITTQRDLSLVVPNIVEQHQFRELFQYVRVLESKTRESTQDSDILFNSLLQRAFRGEL